MSDNESDIEFYSFIQVNEDLSNTEEQSNQDHTQNSQKQQQQVQKEVTLQTSNTSEDQFFKKLSFAFYSTNSNSSSNLKEVPNYVANHGHNRSGKITIQDNQSTQPHTPKCIVSLKQEENSDTKNHHLLKNYQIKKIQNPKFQIDMALYENFMRRKQVINNEEVQQNQNNKQTGNGANLNRNQIVIASQKKQVLAKKNLNNNFAHEQYSYDQPDIEYQENQNGIENKQQNQTSNGFYLQGDQIKRNANMKAQKEAEQTSTYPLNSGRDQQHKQERYSKQNQEYENIETILLNNQQNVQGLINANQSTKQLKFNHGEKKNDFINNFAANRGHLLQQQQPLSSRQIINTDTDLTNNQKFAIENNFQKKNEECINLQKNQQVIPKRSILQINKQQSQQNINNLNQQPKNKGEGQLILENNSALNNNFFKINQKVITQQDTALEEKILFSGRKAKQDNNGGNHNLVSNFNTQNINNNESNHGASQSIKSPIMNKFTPQLRKNGTFNIKDKGYTSPRQSLQPTNGLFTCQDSQNSNNDMTSSVKLNSNTLLFRQIPFNAREDYANLQSNIDLINTKKNINSWQKPALPTSTSTKKFGQNQMQLISSIDSSIKQNKQNKDSQQLLTANMSPTMNSNTNMTSSVKLNHNQTPNSKNQPTLNKEETSNDQKNSFLSQVFKAKASQSGNKYFTKNELVRMPLNNSQKLIETIPSFVSIQNSNNQSYKHISSPKVFSSTALSASKQKFFMNPAKKIDSIYSCDFEDEQSFPTKIAQQ